MNSSAGVRCLNLHKTFVQGEARLEILRGIELSVGPGEQLAITGASGSGKSTLLHILGGLDNPSEGSVEIAGLALSTADEATRGKIRNQHMGFIYQFHHLLPEFTAQENVAMPLLIRGQNFNSAAQAADEILGKVGLSERLQHKPGELSGGERQRAAIARALVSQPACILADEPTGNLDEATAVKVFDLMLGLSMEQGTSLIMVTHNQVLANKLGRQAVLHEGLLIET